MKNTLILAAATALSLSAGAAFAREIPSGNAPNYQAIGWLFPHRGYPAPDAVHSRSSTLHNNPVRDLSGLWLDEE